MDDPRNCLSFWFPILEHRCADRVSLPPTRIIRADTGALFRCLEADERHPGRGELARLVGEIRSAGDEFGWPCFLRTGRTSGKHEWARTCYLLNTFAVAHHVSALVEYSECAGPIGLPFDVWVVRQMLPTVMWGRAYRGMPVNCERRYFFGDGEVLCHHPYWPERAVEEGLRWGGQVVHPEWRESFARFNAEHESEDRELTDLTRIVAEALRDTGEAWSVDWMYVVGRGWVCIDMALAKYSWHWPGCAVARRRGWCDPHEEDEDGAGAGGGSV